MRPLIFLLCCFFAGCTAYKYLGTEQPAIAKSACAIEEETCSIEYNEDGRLTGSYRLRKVGDGTYSLTGSAMLDVSEQSAVWAKISRLQLTFIFFKGDLVVHEESITIRGETNEYLQFSKLIESDTDIESSRWAWFIYRVRE